MPDLLHALPKPFKVPKPNEIKIAALQLPVMEGGKVHCLDVLYALTKRLLGEIEVNILSPSVLCGYCLLFQVSKDMLSEVQKQLERAFPTRKLMFPVTTTLEIRQELKAATVSPLLWASKINSAILGDSTRLPRLEGACHQNKIASVLDTDPCRPSAWRIGTTLRVWRWTATWWGWRLVRSWGECYQERVMPYLCLLTFCFRLINQYDIFNN